MHYVIIFLACFFVIPAIYSVETALCMKLGLQSFFKMSKCDNNQELKKAYDHNAIATTIFNDFFSTNIFNEKAATKEQITTFSHALKKHKPHMIGLKNIFEAIEKCKDLMRINDDQALNQFFINTTFPVLFEHYNFAKMFNQQQCENKLQERFMTVGYDDPLLMNYFIYHCDFPFATAAKYKNKKNMPPLLKIAIEYTLKHGKPMHDHIEISRYDGTLKAEKVLWNMVFCPPSLWIAQEKANIVKSIITFLLCLKQKKQHSVSYNIPKYIKRIIIKQMANHNLQSSYAQKKHRFVVKSIQKEIENMEFFDIRNEHRTGYKTINALWQLIYHSKDWTENTISPAAIILKELGFIPIR